MFFKNLFKTFDTAPKTISPKVSQILSDKTKSRDLIEAIKSERNNHNSNEGSSKNQMIRVRRVIFSS